MSPALLLSPVAALIAGVVASLHCAGMCGPLACAVLPASSADNPGVASTYHLSRIGAYACLGAVAGGLGRLPLSWLPPSVVRYAPFAAAICFLGLALRWDRRWVRPAALARRALHFSRRAGVRRPQLAAAALGLATPLLPCGPLYFFFGLALLAGSALRGAELMMAFGLGTLPLLWLAQSQYLRFQRRLSPRWLGRIRMALALAAAGLAAWRGAIAFAAGSASAPWLCF